MKGLISAIPLVALGCISCGTTTYSHVEPLSPTPHHNPIIEGRVERTSVESTQPLLKWKPVLNHRGTYDVIIYKADVSQLIKSIVVPEEEVYYRENLSGTIHKVEEPLEEDTAYLWTVRTRNGSTTGDWATYDFDIIRPLAAFHYKRHYFLFKTP